MVLWLSSFSKVIARHQDILGSKTNKEKINKNWRQKVFPLGYPVFQRLSQDTMILGSEKRKDKINKNWR